MGWQSYRNRIGFPLSVDLCDCGSLISKPSIDIERSVMKLLLRWYVSKRNHTQAVIKNARETSNSIQIKSDKEFPQLQTCRQVRNLCTMIYVSEHANVDLHAIMDIQMVIIISFDCGFVYVVLCVVLVGCSWLVHRLRMRKAPWIKRRRNKTKKRTTANMKTMKTKLDGSSLSRNWIARIRRWVHWDI